MSKRKISRKKEKSVRNPRTSSGKGKVKNTKQKQSPSSKLAKSKSNNIPTSISSTEKQLPIDKSPLIQESIAPFTFPIEVNNPKPTYDKKDLLKRYNLKIYNLYNIVKNTISKIANKFRSLSHKTSFSTLSKNRLKKIKTYLIKTLNISLKVIIIAILLSGIFIIPASLRYIQVCGYKDISTQGYISVADTNFDFCPSPLSISGLSDIIKNTFSFDTSLIQVNENLRTINLSKDVSVDNCTGVNCIIKNLDSNILKDNERTNLLLVGTDSRFQNIMGNTDSMMLLSYDHRTSEVVSISFPRDLVVRHITNQGWEVYNRINAIFASYGFNDHSVGIQNLNAAISEITGLPVHYYVYFNFNVFREIINQTGGVKIFLDEPFRDAYPCAEVFNGYPKNALGDGYCLFEFPAGWNNFDTFQTDVYARSRHYSSDYARSARQQKVVSALISNIVSGEADLTIDKAINIYNSMSQQVNTNIPVSDALGIYDIVKRIGSDSSKVVLSPSLENGRFIFEAGYSAEFNYHAKFRDYSYTDIRNYISNIISNSTFFRERPKILIKAKDIDKFNQIISDIGINNFVETKFEQISPIEQSGNRLYLMSGKSASMKVLQNRGVDLISYSKEIDNISRSEFMEDIIIILNQ